MMRKVAVDWLDPYFVREEELEARIQRKQITRRWRWFNVNDAIGTVLEVPQSKYWLVDLINATVGTGPAAAAFYGQITLGKPAAVTGGLGDLTYFLARTDDYAGANTVFYQIGGGSGFADANMVEYLDMSPILLEPGDRIHFNVGGAAALSSFYGVLWFWESDSL
jgi:hypothetical protein